MLDVSKLKRLLDKWNKVILVKTAKWPHPTSYSFVDRYEWDDIWRTPFEATRVSDVSDYELGHFTISKDLMNNPRISIQGIAPEEIVNEFNGDSDYDYDDDYEHEEVDTDDTPIVNESSFIKKLIGEIKKEITPRTTVSTPQVVDRPAVKQTNSRRRRVSL